MKTYDEPEYEKQIPHSSVHVESKRKENSRLLSVWSRSNQDAKPNTVIDQLGQVKETTGKECKVAGPKLLCYVYVERWAHDLESQPEF